MARRLDAHQPGLGALFGCDRMPDAIDVKAAMGAGTDAGIFLAAPINQIMSAFRAWAGVIGYFVSR